MNRFHLSVYSKGRIENPYSGFTLDVTSMAHSQQELTGLSALLERAHSGLQDIEAGKIKNPDENRAVTHFTDRMEYKDSRLFQSVEEFTNSIRNGVITNTKDESFESVIVNGIGGSALGPQFIQLAMNGPYWNELPREVRNSGLKIYFIDNTDPAGLTDVLAVADLSRTLVLSISKSGGTRETENNLIALQTAYTEREVPFAAHAAAITMRGSQLDMRARDQAWLKVFEMAESIGGRTSETSIVGHVPASLSGIDFSRFLDGACHMDQLTRDPDVHRNPAYLLAAQWYLAGNGRGDRNMVIVPYSDRLMLFSKYLQQLVMESLGKKLDLDGKVVEQGLTVYGNKGGSDAHAYIQQLNDGRNDFFITLIEVLNPPADYAVGNGLTMGDYLHGFQVGLARALMENDRQVIQITIREVNPFNVGMLVALYERAVAAYAEMIHVNAFHQPGVQAYKLASNGIIKHIENFRIAWKKRGKFTGTLAEIKTTMDVDMSEEELEVMLRKISENRSLSKITDMDVHRIYESGTGWVYHIVAGNQGTE